MPKTILVVDDEMLIALDIEAELSERGHRVLTAPTLQIAKSLIANERIDVAIVDWHLSQGTAASLIQELSDRQIPFVVCSGSSLEELAGLFGAMPVVSKPFQADTLVAALSAASGEESWAE